MSRQERDPRQPDEQRDKRDVRGPDEPRDERDERREGDPRDPRDVARLGDAPDAAQMAATAQAMHAPSKARKAMALVLGAGLAFGGVVGWGVISNRGDIVTLQDQAKTDCVQDNHTKDVIAGGFLALGRAIGPGNTISAEEREIFDRLFAPLFVHEKCGTEG